MANSHLTNAKKAKNDEFYTQYHDIEKEIAAYIECNPDVFRGKTVLLPCDDPEWSNFTKLFAQNFERFGLKKLISTSYAVDSKIYKKGYQPTLFETNDPQYDQSKTTQNGKIFTLTHDKTGDGKIDVDDLEWHYLIGDGDFNSDFAVNNADFAILAGNWQATGTPAIGVVPEPATFALTGGALVTALLGSRRRRYWRSRSSRQRRYWRKQ